MKISIVIPVYNSARSLVSLIHGIEDYFNASEHSYDVILVDDGSTNPVSWDTISELSKECDNVFGIRFRKNFGKPNALLCGFRKAKGDYVLTLDDDQQHLPNVLDDLLEENAHDVVIGKYKKSRHGLLKRILSGFKNKLEVWAYKKPSNIHVSPVKLIKKEIIDDIVLINSNRPFIAALLFSVTHDIVNVNIDHLSRQEGKSGFTIAKMWSTISNMLFNNSSLLLKGIAFLGAFCFIMTGSLMIFSFFMGKMASEEKILGAIGLSTGTILFAIGIVGEYLIRIIAGIETKQGYYIKETTENEA